MLDLLIRGARIRTLDPVPPTAQTIGIGDGLTAGLDEQIAGNQNAAGPKSREAARAG